MSSIATRKLGKNGPEVTAPGLGFMSFTGFYGWHGTNETRQSFIDYAYNAGERFWDTADIYEDNQKMLGEWFAKNPDKRENVVLCTKLGASMTQPIRNDEPYIHHAIARNLRELQTDYIDLLYLHRIQYDQPIEISMRVLKTYVESGKIRHIGLSECSAETLRRAHAVHPVTAVQVEYSPWSLDIETNGVLDACRELGVAVVAYSPLGRGMVDSFRKYEDLPANDFRRMLPRFQPETFHKNVELADKLRAFAAERKVSVNQLVMAWLMTQSDLIIPIPGTTKTAKLDDNLATGALLAKLTPEEIKTVRELVESANVVGDRYPAAITPDNPGETVPLEGWQPPATTLPIDDAKFMHISTA